MLFFGLFTLLFHKFLFYLADMEHKIINYGSADYKKMILLRTKVLRIPLGLTYSAEDLARDKTDILLASFEGEEIIGCCILTKVDNENLQLRQMAVLDSFQQKGIGSNLIQFAEKIAKEKFTKTIILHARKVVAEFYLKNGYSIEGDEFVEVNIPHYQMRKKL